MWANLSSSRNSCEGIIRTFPKVLTTQSMPPKCYKCCCYCDYISYLFWFITHLTCPTGKIREDLEMCSPSLGPHAQVFLSSYLPRQAELFMVTDVIWASVLRMGSQTSSLGITWDHIRNAVLRPPPQTHSIRNSGVGPENCISNMVPGGIQESVPYKPRMGSWWTLGFEEPAGWGQVSSYAESLHSPTSVEGSSWCWCQLSINNRALYKQKGIF